MRRQAAPPKKRAALVMCDRQQMLKVGAVSVSDVWWASCFSSWQQRLMSPCCASYTLPCPFCTRLHCWPWRVTHQDMTGSASAYKYLQQGSYLCRCVASNNTDNGGDVSAFPRLSSE